MELSKIKIMRPYEGIYIVHPDSSVEAQKSFFKKNKEIIAQEGGEMNHIDSWGKRKLANPIKKINNAIYFHTTFTADPSSIKELERTMKINDSVLRYVHYSIDPKLDCQKHLEKFRQVISESNAREQEREAKFQAKRAKRSHSGGPRPPRNNN